MRYLWFPGIDPARDRDYLTVVINGLPATRSSPWLPALRDIYRYKKKSLTGVLQWLVNDLFKKFPPTIGYVDETHDPTFAEVLVQRFPNRLNPLRFGNAGATNTKLDLKLIGRDMLSNGYTFPDVGALLRENRIAADKAYLVTELKEEALREVTKLTTNDRITFDHPEGKHNDLVHAWEMSLKAVVEFQKKKGMGFSNDELITAGITEAQYYARDDTDTSDILDVAKERLAKRGLDPDEISILGNW